MFKELGALIDAAGEVVAKSMKISANAVKEALSDKDDNDGATMGILVPKDMNDFINKFHSEIVKYGEIDEDGEIIAKDEL